MSARVTATVVCCILMQILCVVSQKSFSFWGNSSPSLPLCPPNNPVRSTPLLKTNPKPGPHYLIVWREMSMLLDACIVRWRWLRWTSERCCTSTANCVTPNAATWLLCVCNRTMTSREPTSRNSARDYVDSDVTERRRRWPAGRAVCTKRNSSATTGGPLYRDRHIALQPCFADIRHYSTPAW